MGSMKRSKTAFTLFTPGPVMMTEEVLLSLSKPLPYFRTEAFSKSVLTCENSLLRLLKAPSGYRVAFLTASGTGAMEAALGCFDRKDALTIVNTGSFGERFCEIAASLGLTYEEWRAAPGHPLTPLSSASRKTSAAVVACHHETTTGTVYDLDLLSGFAKSKNALLVIDAISSFLADPIDLSRHPIDALILSSHKGIGLPPGLSFVILSPRMIRKIQSNRPRSYYFDLGRALKDGLRGQTPFTPAIGLVLALEKRLTSLARKGAEHEIKKTRMLALDFRKRIQTLPLTLFSLNPSNALTALVPHDGRSAGWYVSRLQEDFSLFVCPNGGPLQDTVFRVGHLGHLSKRDNERLALALQRLAKQAKPNRRLAA